MRKLPVWAWVALVVAYLAIIQGLSTFLTRDIDTAYASPTTVAELWRSITVPVGVSLVFVLGIVAVARWWRPVFLDTRPVRRWLWAIPIIQLVCILAATNYGGLAEKGAGFVMLLLFSTLMVGLAEETMFRGIGLTALRDRFTEGQAALWSTVLFGVAHATNLISEGPKAFLQVLLAAVSGYFFYIGRRVSGGLLVPALLHGLWDFSLISSGVVPGKQYLGGVVAMIGIPVMTLLLIVRRHHIEPPATSPTRMAAP